MPILNEITQDIRSFLIEAGNHALKIQSTAKRSYKQREQAVTNADLDISHMAADRLSCWLERDDHILIDEETIDNIPSPAKVFAKTRYQWVLDPIDGTAGYALGRDRWGVSLGVLKDGLPVCGGFYLPAIGMLMMLEDRVSYCTNMRTGEKISIPKAKPMEINSQIFVESFFGFENCWGENAKRNKIWLNTPECALQGFYSTFKKQACAMTFYEIFSIWDIAGAAVIARATGHEIISLKNDQVFKRFCAENIKENWKISGKWIMAHRDNYSILKQALIGSA